MKTISFEIAKKMGKAPAGASGFLLSSLKWEGGEASMVLKSGDLNEIKERVDALRREEPWLHYRARGRSLEVSSQAEEEGPSVLALERLISFAVQLDFACDDAADVLRFAADAAADGPEFQVISFLLDQNSLSLKAQAQLAEEEEPEDFYRLLMQSLTRYGMGVMKN